METLQLDRDGLEHHHCFFTANGIGELEDVLGPTVPGAGLRIFGNRPLAEWIAIAGLLNLVRTRTGPTAHPVRAILFDKTRNSNWVLGWHQDRTIAVRARLNEPGFCHWTTKAGVQHVEPPFEIIERMVTARIHLDAVTATNAPLLAAPGSHRLGRLKETDIDATVSRCGTVRCLARRGDVWLYRSAILHASERSDSTDRRRVVQIDFSTDSLPGNLEWLGLE